MRKLSSHENAAIAVLICEAIVRELGEKASLRRVMFVPENSTPTFCRVAFRKLSPLEITRKAEQRASDRFKREEERICR